MCSNNLPIFYNPIINTGKATYQVIRMYDEQYEEGYDEAAAADEAAYQEMCDAEAEQEAEQIADEGEAEAESVKQQLQEIIDHQQGEATEQQLKEMQRALEHGTINKDPNSKYTPDELTDTNMFKQGVYAKEKKGNTQFG